MKTKECCRCHRNKTLDEFNFSQKGLHQRHTICKVCKAKYMKEYNASGKLKISKNKYRESSKGKNTESLYRKSDKNKLIQTNYRKSDLGRSACVSKLARYRAIKKQALPEWVNIANIREIYENCPKDYEVDHIIPLQNDILSGLHVPWNLQYLSRRENAVKSNSFDGTYDNNGWRADYAELNITADGIELAGMSNE